MTNLRSSLFDLDQTLLKVNSAHSIGTYLLQKKIVPKFTFLTIYTYYLFHRVGLVSLNQMNQFACNRFFLGKSIHEIKAYVEAFLEEHFDQMLNHPLLDELDRAKKEGHYTVILSSSPHFLVGPISERLGVDEWGATQYALDEYRITGIESYMDGDAKAGYLKSLCGRLNIPQSQTTAYSDSHHDLPFLLAAGEAVVVNPTRKLAKCAKGRGFRKILSQSK